MTSLHVILVEPEIHWNTGNVGRTCLAAGAQLHLVEPLGFSLDEREVRRAGLDYWPRVQPRLWPSWDAVDAALTSRELGEPFLFAPGRGRTLFETRFPADVALVFGKESVGLPDAVLDARAEAVVHLPMLDGALRSINVSTTAGIAMYEVRRQWSFRG